MDRSFALPLRLPRRRPFSIALPRRPRRPLLTLAAVLLLLPALGGGWLWLRDSPLAAVEQVRVTGARGSEAHAIDVALEEAATRMSTLHVNLGALRAAVAPFHVVRDLHVSASFPHTLRIHVIEQPAVAALEVAGVKTAVAADGAVLGPSLLTTSLPLLRGTTGDLLTVGHVHSASTLAALAVLGAAPPALAGWVARVYDGREGLTVAMRNGLELYFGDATRPHAKWLSAARVIADPSAAGAWYVDVRLPERPAAGLAGGAAGAAESTAGGSTQVSASDPAAASLAASLAEAVNGAAGGAGSPATSTGIQEAASQAIGVGVSTNGSASPATGSTTGTATGSGGGSGPGSTTSSVGGSSAASPVTTPSATPTLGG